MIADRRPEDNLRVVVEVPSSSREESMINAGTGHLTPVQSGAEPHAVREAVTRLKDYLTSQIVGQDKLVERLLVALLADGHLLVEGPPGLAKTRAIKALAHALEADFQRVQFTPDLLPADLTGSDIYRPRSEEHTSELQSPVHLVC